jgi:hypothetical protein
MQVRVHHLNPYIIAYIFNKTLNPRGKKQVMTTLSIFIKFFAKLGMTPFQIPRKFSQREKMSRKR